MPALHRNFSTDLTFQVWQNDDGTWPRAYAQLAVLMDIRDELKKLNKLLYCSNFTGIPTTLRSIRRAMPTKRRKTTRTTRR